MMRTVVLRGSGQPARVAAEQVAPTAGRVLFGARDPAGAGLPIPPLFPKPALLLEREAQDSHHG